MRRPLVSRSRSIAAGLALGFTWGLLGLSLAPAASAGQSRLELRDGSVLTAELVGVEAGGYRIRSAVLGEVVLDESQVLAICPVGDGSAGAAPVATLGGVEAAGTSTAALPDLQARMMGDSDIMAAIQSLQSDPDLQAALADPAFARAVLGGDIETLQQDPRFLKLMEHPTVRGIIGEMTGE